MTVLQDILKKPGMPSSVAKKLKVYRSTVCRWRDGVMPSKKYADGLIALFPGRLDYNGIFGNPQGNNTQDGEEN